MNIRRLNWPLWAGFLLSLSAFISYPTLFVRFPATRDFPWVNLLLFLMAGVLVLLGLRRAFRRDRPRPKLSKVAGITLTALSAGVLALFILVAFVAARRLPASQAAPQVGQKAPDFIMSDSDGKPVSLSQLVAAPIKASPPKGVLLIFYRGYW
ncbi:MAG: hypothetical protein ABI967_04305 [bacterium]